MAVAILLRIKPIPGTLEWRNTKNPDFLKHCWASNQPTNSKGCPSSDLLLQETLHFLIFQPIWVKILVFIAERLLSVILYQHRKIERSPNGNLSAKSAAILVLYKGISQRPDPFIDPSSSNSNAISFKKILSSFLSFVTVIWICLMCPTDLKTENHILLNF